MNIENFCLTNLQLLNEYKNPSSTYNIVEARLEESFRAYTTQLDAGLKYLSRREELKLLKKLNKMRK